MLPGKRLLKQIKKHITVGFGDTLRREAHLFSSRSDGIIETRSLAPLHRVLVALNVGSEFVSVLIIDLIRLWVGILAVLCEDTERRLRRSILLSSGNETAISSVI